MIDPIRHYALENPATVYDEESLTVLELVARLAGKVNECISAENVIMTHIDVLNELVKSGKLTATGLIPSGDKTGNVDRVNMQTMLDTFGVCPLGTGTFYINEPLDMHAGNVLTGKGVSATKIRVERGDGFFHSGNADHLTFRDFTLDGDGNTTGIGFHFRGTTSGDFTGVRYSTFENVDVNGFNTGAVLRGVWCSTFKHCRFILTAGGEYCVKQEGTCNNNVYEHCAFIGNETGTGAFISAEGGAQNCGNTFTDCDFEKLAVAIRGYSAVSLNVQNIYAEGVGVVFQLDSCPNFNCNGGYAVYIDRLCNVSVSNTLPMYKGKRGKISNVVCRLRNVGTDNWLITATDPVIYNMETEGLSLLNDGATVYVTDRDKNQKYGCGMDYPCYTVMSPEISTGDSWRTVYINPPVGVRAGEQIKVIDAKIIPQEDFTLTVPASCYLRINNVDQWTFTLWANTQFTKNTPVNGTPATTHSVYGDGDTMCVVTADGVSSYKYKVKVKIAVGEMVIETEV